MKKLRHFNKNQIKTVNNAVALAEELVSNHYKLSANHWLRHQYDIKTLNNLTNDEIVDIPFAQVIRYKGQKKETSLGSSSYDFYKICIQDHNILSALNTSSALNLFAFTLYIVSHELIHIVRFSKFLQNFEASYEEKMAEEIRVHNKTYEILSKINIPDLEPVLNYKGWKTPQESLVYL
ncbi:conserved hypothetical protein [Candidatus Magnetomoraceae bacterium gMMP-1]